MNVEAPSIIDTLEELELLEALNLFVKEPVVGQPSGSFVRSDHPTPSGKFHIIRADEDYLQDLRRADAVASAYGRSLDMSTSSTRAYIEGISMYVRLAAELPPLSKELAEATFVQLGGTAFCEEMFANGSRTEDEYGLTSSITHVTKETFLAIKTARQLIDYAQVPNHKLIGFMQGVIDLIKL